MAEKNYDLIIIGAGSAGFSAAIYAARYKLKTLIMYSKFGGAIVEAHVVENYPGIKKISGMELMDKFKEHAEKFNVPIIEEEVQKIKKSKDGFILNNKYSSKAVILCLGTERRKLNVEGEERFAGKGISYCYTCDAPFYKERIVGVVGGNDAAAMASLLCAEYAKKVYIIYRKEKLRCEPYYLDLIKKNKKIEIINNTEIQKINGDKLIKSVTFKDSKEFKLDGLFVEIGAIPSTILADSLGVKLDKNKYIIVDKAQKTNVRCVFAAGDVTTNSNNMQQVVTAAAEGAIAAQAVYMDLKKD